MARANLCGDNSLLLRMFDEVFIVLTVCCLALSGLASGYNDSFIRKWGMTCIFHRFVIVLVKSIPWEDGTFCRCETLGESDRE